MNAVRGSTAPFVRGWEVVIGLETHAQLSTVSKIFSGAATAFGAAPNMQACAVDLALPGTLPVLNRGAVQRAERKVLTLGVQALAFAWKKPLDFEGTLTKEVRP